MRYKMMVEVRSFWLAFHKHNEIRSKWSYANTYRYLIPFLGGKPTDKWKVAPLLLYGLPIINHIKRIVEP